MLKEQKIGLLILTVFLFSISVFLITNLHEILEFNELNSLFIPTLLFGLFYSGIKLLRKPNSEIYEIHCYKDIYYNFCNYFVIGSIAPLTLMSIYYTLGSLYYHFTCWFGSSNNCDFNLNILYLVYTTSFIIVVYGFSKKLKSDKEKIKSDYEKRLKLKQERIEELDLKLRKSVNNDEKINDLEY